jgi:hypothetical protein
MFSEQTETFLGWYRKLWGQAEGDAEAAVASAEKRLGIRLPEMLKAVYLNTSLRDSQMLHLAELNKVSVKDGVLVFASVAERGG